MIKKVIWSSLIDYPNEISTVLFVDGCNFTCSYCHNRELSKEKSIDFDIILRKLIERKHLVNHVVLSGGECTLDAHFNWYVKKLVQSGFKVGIHTNMSRPFKLYNSLDLISFIGGDIKTELDNYYKLTSQSSIKSEIKSSLKILRNFSKNNIVELRTTINPEYINMKSLQKIKKLIKGYRFNKKNTEWILQKCLTNGRDKKFDDLDNEVLGSKKLKLNIPTKFRNY